MWQIGALAIALMALIRILESLRRSEGRTPPVSSLDFAAEIDKFVSLDGITAHYIKTGPSPSFSQSMLDIFLLTDDCLYNLDVRTQGAMWHTLPLPRISHITERINGDFLTISLHAMGESAIEIQDRVANEVRLHKFYGVLRDRLLGNAESQDSDYSVERLREELDAAAEHMRKGR